MWHYTCKMHVIVRMPCITDHRPLCVCAAPLSLFYDDMIVSLKHLSEHDDSVTSEFSAHSPHVQTILEILLFSFLAHEQKYLSHTKNRQTP